MANGPLTVGDRVCLVIPCAVPVLPFTALPSAMGRPTPTPEPGTWVLMGTGLVGLLGYGWRRKKRQAV